MQLQPVCLCGRGDGRYPWECS